MNNLNKYLQKISKDTGISPKQVDATVTMLMDANTIPFIARYRKEKTDNLDEIQIKKINDMIGYYEELEERKEKVLKVISELGKLSTDLKNKIDRTFDKTELEDLYAPYKPKRSTRGQVAREKGLEPLSDLMFDCKIKSGTPEDYAQKFVNPQKKVNTPQEALNGACDIIAEIISDNTELRKYLRNTIYKNGLIKSENKKNKDDDGLKYKDYFNYEERVCFIPSHRILAIFRGDKENILKINFIFDTEKVINYAKKLYSKHSKIFSYYIHEAIKDGFKRLLNPSIINEVKKTLKEKAYTDSVKVFSQNIKNILMVGPLGEKKVLSIDPGIRTGGKLAVISESGDFIEGGVLYWKDNNKKEGQKILNLLKKYNIEYIALGNGTGSREIQKYLSNLFKSNNIKGTNVVIVNESGASIYSASKIASDEFPQLDLTLRSAVSIGRRLQDPLAELVKIDPKSIGVGQYQHDIDQKMLKKELDETILFCVNKVGVNLNTASIPLLKYVSGITPKTANKIVEFREKNGLFKSRDLVKKVPGIGQKSFTQCAGFFRVKKTNPIENTGIHPEHYYIVDKICRKLNKNVSEICANPEILDKLNPEEFTDDFAGEYTLKDIFSQLKAPGLDVREKFENIEFREDVNEISDLKKNMILNGVITNITNFGAFCDIGVHQDGLIHISQITSKFIKNPDEVLKTGQHVKVKVTDFNVNRKRISLTMRF
ncbi:MAG: Tex family protein [Candidatus Muiribacteriota bacterium]